MTTYQQTVLKLPAPEDDDLSQGILEAIDLDSYRVEVREGGAIALPDAGGEVGPVPTGAAGGRPEPELDRLSVILNQFNDLFGNIPWTNEDKIARAIAEDIPAMVLADTAYLNAIKHSDKQNARIEHDKALGRAIVSMLADHTELYTQFSDHPEFKKWLSDTIFSTTYRPST